MLSGVDTLERYQQVKIIRQASGLSQKEFGRRIGVSRDQIAALESGRVTTIQPVLFEHLCEIYRVNPQWLETGEKPVLTNPSEELYQRALAIFSSLNPELQQTAVEQIRILLDLQSSKK
jgi:transcriptional regulator with XRE-family HTH domain